MPKETILLMESLSMLKYIRGCLHEDIAGKDGEYYEPKWHTLQSLDYTIEKLSMFLEMKGIKNGIYDHRKDHTE